MVDNDAWLQEVIADLQTRVAFQEDQLQSLDTQISQQDRQLLNLQAQLQHLYTKMKTIENPLGAEQESPPPHY